MPVILGELLESRRGDVSEGLQVGDAVIKTVWDILLRVSFISNLQRLDFSDFRGFSIPE